MSKMVKRIICIALVVCFVQVFSNESIAAFIKGTDIPSIGIYTLSPTNEIDMGRAGIIKVNQFNQELMAIRNDIELPGDNMPVSICFFYSSFPNNYGNEKWKNNYAIKISWTREKNIEFLKEDGTKSIFKKSDTIQNGKQKWITSDELSSLETLWLPVNAKDFSQAVMETILKKVYYFDSMGRVIKIYQKDEENSFIEITYLDDSFKIDKIVDGSGHIYQFTYNEKDLLSEIQVQNQMGVPISMESESGDRIYFSVKYFYDWRNNLIQVTYPDSKSVFYKYSWNRLKQIKNVDGKTINIQYDGNMVTDLEQCVGKSIKQLLAIKRTGKNKILYSDEYNKNIEKSFNELGMPEVNADAQKDMPKHKENKGIAKETAPTDQTHKLSVQRGEQSTIYTDGSEAMIDQYQYISDKGYLSEKIDINGIRQKYEYDQNTGLLLYEKKGQNNIIAYQYDSSMNLIRASMDLSSIAGTIENQYVYDNDKLVEIKHNDMSYQILYDIWGNESGVSVGREPLICYRYMDGKTQLCQTVEYGNGQSIRYEYDSKNRITKISSENDKCLFSFDYSEDNITTVYDYCNGTRQIYYDEKVEIYDMSTSKKIFGIYLSENEDIIMQIGQYEYCIQDKNYYNEDGKTVVYTFGDNQISVDLEIIRDYFERSKSVSVINRNGESYSVHYQYQGNGDYTTGLIQRYATEYTYQGIPRNNVWSYEYNQNGQIIEIKKDNKLYASYKYDLSGQLIQEDNRTMQERTEYLYDKGGNLTQKIRYLSRAISPTEIINYTYNNDTWKDEMTSYNNIEIEYDAVGNPVQYGSCKYTWASGKHLEVYENNAQKVKYTYDTEGRRLSKSIFDQKSGDFLYQYNYFWYGNHLLSQKIADYTKGEEIEDTVIYQFDENGNYYGFIVNGSTSYLYEKNAQGDITGILKDGAYVGQYAYDAFGNIIVQRENPEIQKWNCIYYRNYCYDKESKMYYLNSRYYVPEWGRFLNADTYIDTGTGLIGTNMFAYCDNDPVNKIDPMGNWSQEVHQELTKLLSADFKNYNINNIAYWNADTDDTYSAWKFSYFPSYQGKHFDRHIRLSETNGEDSRVYYGTNYFDQAIAAYRANKINEMNKWLGYGLHCYQDLSAHGNIDANTWALASHVGINADETNYIWADDKDRGLSYKIGCVTKIPNTSGSYRGPRYEEASVSTVLYMALFNYAIS